MTKKNLSDLLKAEVQSGQSPPAVPQEGSSLPDGKADPDAPSKPTPGKNNPQSSASRQSTSSSQKRSTSRSAATKASAPAAKIAPEARVLELEAELKATQGREAALQKKVQGLQQDLEKQQERLFELKDALEQAQRSAKADAETLSKVSQELEEAKQLILKLSESATPTEAPAATPAPPAAELTIKTRHGGDIYQGRRLPAYKGIPAYAIDPGDQKNRMLSDEEIGWVD